MHGLSTADNDNELVACMHTISQTLETAHLEVIRNVSPAFCGCTGDHLWSRCARLHNDSISNLKGIDLRLALIWITALQVLCSCSKFASKLECSKGGYGLSVR